ncbi:MAG TPA: hypothetical protein VHE36_14635 [Sphingomicrobium sp.]|jgi:hypothetical protein|nr:hypothetical protein [Sphingomicrobium sp.]
MDRVIIYRALMFGVCGYALFRGKTDARIVALVFLVGDFATLALRSPLAGSYSSVETGILIVDVLAFLAFTYAALISDRFWPLWVSGFQLTTSFGHVLKAADTQLMPLAYAAALRFWAYPILIILAVGTWRSHRRTLRERAATAAA